jgi:hypothetical protein
MAVAISFAVILVGAWIYMGHHPLGKRESAEELAVVYECLNSDGSRYRQNTPCLFLGPQPDHGGPVSYAPSQPAAPKVNPNQWLLDRADERHEREVQSAASAQRRLDQQIAAARASEAERHYRDYSCTALCSDLRSLQADMRSGYSAAQSVWFHERQNAIYKQMQQQDCRACF